MLFDAKISVLLFCVEKMGNNRSKGISIEKSSLPLPNFHLNFQSPQHEWLQDVLGLRNFVLLIQTPVPLIILRLFLLLLHHLLLIFRLRLPPSLLLRCCAAGLPLPHEDVAAHSEHLQQRGDVLAVLQKIRYCIMFLEEKFKSFSDFLIFHSRFEIFQKFA